MLFFFYKDSIDLRQRKIRSGETEVGRSCNKVKNRSTAGILAAIMLFAVLLSAFYIASNADHYRVHHDCGDHDCPVCICIQQCESMLRGLDNGISDTAVLCIPLLLLYISISSHAHSFAENTLVSDKVRLNN